MPHVVPEGSDSASLFLDTVTHDPLDRGLSMSEQDQSRCSLFRFCTGSSLAVGCADLMVVPLVCSDSGSAISVKRRQFVWWCGVLCLGFGVASHTACSQEAAGQVVQGAGQQLTALANQARAEQGLGKLQWDEGLAAAARDQCLRMAAEGPIAHRYGGEDDLSTRAGKAGAHFDLIEENVAIGPNAAEIHDEWMQSPGHRANLLNAGVNRVGIAVVVARGVLYATADYARAVQTLTQEQVEARVASFVRVSGVTILANHDQARAACASEGGLAVTPGKLTPGFMMKWQDSELKQLPQPLAEKLESGQYRRAAIGSCPAKDVEGDFTVYRVAVLLYY